MNRTIQPALNSIKHLRLNQFHQTELSNGIPVYSVSGVEEDLIKIELRFPAGRWYEKSLGQSHATSALMRKGTSTKSALQIAEEIEFYGAQLDTSSGNDSTGVTLLTMGKHLHHVLPVLVEILTDASFPENEIALYKERKKQRYRIQAKNTDFHANRKFSEVLFGKQHPYGYALQEEEIDLIQAEELKAFFKSNYQVAHAKIFVSGNIPDTIYQTLDQAFGSFQKNKLEISSSDKSLHPSLEKEFYVELKESVQSSIRVGGISIAKNHKDFPDLNVMNTLFGGYFGSRLMRNIREDKGYTYGIYSSISHQKHISYFSIETEAGNEVCIDTLSEIYKEMELLRNVQPSIEELTIVKNFMLGSLLRATDGPFNRINMIKGLVMTGVDFSVFDKVVGAIQEIKPERIKELANIYLQPEQMKEIVCGNVPQLIS